MPNYIEQRPWGEFEILKEIKVQDEKSQDTTVKKITIKPNSRLSYQSHKLRSENWIFIQGKGKVIIDDKEQEVRAGDIIQIPKGAKHRAINSHKNLDLLIIEVSLGHFDENEYTRYEDDYGR